MKKTYILPLMASLFALGACNYVEDDFAGIEQYQHPTDIRTDTITLATSAYSDIAKLAANRNIALSKDPEGQTYLNALDAVGTNGYFTEDAQAIWYLPAYLADQYPYLDNTSKILVRYNQYTDLPGYLKDFNGTTTYELSSSDYRSVWGESVSATYLTPSTVRQIPNILANAISNPTEGTMKLVNYVYSETEPSTGGGETPMVFRKVDEMEAAGGRYVIAAQAPDGTYYPFGKLDNADKPYGYMNPDPITVTDGVISSDEGGAQVMEISKTGNGYSLLNAWGQYVYNDAAHNNFNVSTSFPSSGGEWAFNANGDGTYAIVNVETGKTVKLYPYGGSYSFACYPEDIFATATYYNETVGEGQGSLSIQDVSLGEGASYVWKYDDGYQCMKASAFVNGANVPTESWIVTPEIDLTDAQSPVFSMEMALNFLRGANRADFVNVMVSADYAGDVTTATWEEVEIPVWPEGSNWTFINSGDADLSAFKGEKIHLAFKYVSTSSTAVTWEIKNLLVKDQSNYWDVYLFQEVPETEIAMANVATRAASDVNASAVYRYSNGAWSQYTSDDADIAVVQPADYDQMGHSYISNAAATLPTYLQQNYPYAQADDAVAVVYYTNSDGDIAATGYTFNGTEWTETVVAQPASSTFQKMNGEWIEAKVYYEVDFVASGEAGYTIQDIELSSLGYVWKLDGQYGWKASGYVGGNNYQTESWIVSPEIDLNGAVAPSIVLNMAINYLSGGDLSTLFNVKVSTDYTDDVTTATWETLNITGWPAGNSWTFNETNPCDMSKYAGQTIRLGFCYTSTTSTAPTIEIMNISIQE